MTCRNPGNQTEKHGKNALVLRIVRIRGRQCDSGNLLQLQEGRRIQDDWLQPRLFVRSTEGIQREQEKHKRRCDVSGS
jgi:hypothetical protein